jgi:hypothetical protein
MFTTETTQWIIGGVAFVIMMAVVVSNIIDKFPAHTAQ